MNQQDENATKVAHLTSAHGRFDTRIYLKECKSLAANGFDVSLVVADGLPDESRDGIQFYGVEKGQSRYTRMRRSSRLVYLKAKSLKADVYHLHDPELLPYALKLQKQGARVIFDAHEDLPKQLLSKPYINPLVRRAIAWLLGVYEAYVCRRLSGVITATPTIRDKFAKINTTTTDINNYPLLGELSTESSDWVRKSPSVCYIGGISTIRGCAELVEAMQSVGGPVKLQMAGNFTDSTIESRCKQSGGWERVNYLGYLNREEVRDLLAVSMAGLVTFYPSPNHVDAQPNKMFEYMSSGIPVIGSRFPLWQEIIEGNNCGICVDPLDPEEVAKAISFIVQNPDTAESMGENGKRAVEERYNWGVEEKRLIDYYTKLNERTS
ncbi:WblG protein [gamma proteobacterium HTCC5015]|nr:WblG protein [gamma proteobacterium HTCC5015]